MRYSSSLLRKMARGGDRGQGSGHAAVNMENVSGDISPELSPSTSDGRSSPQVDPLVARINQRLQRLIEPTANGGRRPSIYRVHPDMRKVEAEADEPKLVSIGPLHRGKDRLLPMEQVKLEYLRDLLKPHRKNSLEKYVAVIRSCLPAAKKHYSENIELFDVDFAEMLVVDGCFIIEYLVKRFSGAVYSSVRWVSTRLRRDLLLLENQIPFFVLTDLFDKTEISYKGELTKPPVLMELVLVFLKIEKPPKVNLSRGKVLHLLHLQHLCLKPDPEEDEPRQRSCGQRAMLRLKESIAPIFTCLCACCSGATEKSKAPRMIPCAKELHEAGIKFRRKGSPRGLRDQRLEVSFRKGTLEIPFLSVDETTSAWLRNLIALEQHRPDLGNHVTGYCVFMDSIINTPKDVAILRNHGIVQRKIGSDAETANLFNSLYKGANLWDNPHYDAEHLLTFCENNSHRWRASLMRDYLGNPWKVASVIAAIFLLLMTAAQTSLTIYRVIHSPKPQ